MKTASLSGIGYFEDCSDITITGGTIRGVNTAWVFEDSQNILITGGNYPGVQTAVRAKNVNNLTVEDITDVDPSRSVKNRRLSASEAPRIQWLSEESLQICIEILRKGAPNGNVRNRWWEKYFP